MKLTNCIKHLLVDCGISESELARRLGVSPSSLNKKMHTDNFTMQELEDIAVTLGVSFEARFVMPNSILITY